MLGRLSRWICVFVAFGMLASPSFAENSYDKQIKEIELIQQLLAAHEITYEDEESQFEEPIWMETTDGIPYVTDGKIVRKRVKGLIDVAKVLGVDKLIKANLPLAQRVVIELLPKKSVDKKAEDKIMAKIKERSASIRRQTFADIEELQTSFAIEIRDLKTKSAALNEALTTTSSDENDLPFDISGKWFFTEGTEFWTFSGKGDGTYSAQESGFSNATGTAKVNGASVRIEFKCGGTFTCVGHFDGTRIDDDTFKATRSDGAAFTFRRVN